MSISGRVAKNSTIYAGANLLQRFFAFLLLPLYTRYLTPESYGIIAVVTALSMTLGMVLNLSFSGAITRFHFEYKDSEKLKEFRGTLLIFVSLFSLFVGGLLLLVGEYFFAPLLGDVPFWPYMAVGVAGAIFFPIYDLFLSAVQVEERSKRFAWVTISNFIVRAGIAITLVVGAGMQAEGPLIATAVTTILYAILALFLIKPTISFTFKAVYLKEALSYSLPLLPHTLVTQIKHITDKLFLNSMVNTASAGIYNLGFHIGSLTAIVAIAANRAFIPPFMSAMKSGNRKELEELEELASLLVYLYVMISLFMSFFAKEIVTVLATKYYIDGFVVIPFIAFSFAARGIYFLFVNTLFYHKKATKFVVIGSATGMVINVVFNWFFIRWWGLVGAAIATMLSQVITTIVIAIIAHPMSKIKWHYFRYSALFILAILLAVFINKDQVLPTFHLFILKVVILVSAGAGASLILWNNPSHAFNQIKKVRKFF